MIKAKILKKKGRMYIENSPQFLLAEIYLCLYIALTYCQKVPTCFTFKDSGAAYNSSILLDLNKLSVNSFSNFSIFMNASSNVFICRPR